MSDEDMSSLLPDEEAAAVIDVVRNLLLAYEDERPDVAADMLLEAAERWHRYRITLVLGISSARHMRIQLALTKAATGQPAMAGFEYGTFTAAGDDEAGTVTPPSNVHVCSRE